jgi:hypothetical protein
MHTIKKSDSFPITMTAHFKRPEKMYLPGEDQSPSAKYADHFINLAYTPCVHF